jgi:hypothetical protein
LTGNKYRELLKTLNLHKALECQLHAGFRPDFHHSVSKYESHYLPGSDDLKWKPPPLTEDYSKLGTKDTSKMKRAITKYWKTMTPEQKALEIAKRRRNASEWRRKSDVKGTIRLRDFTTKYIVINTKKQKDHAKRTKKFSP